MTTTVYISIKGTKLGISVHQGRVVSTMLIIFLLLRKDYSITELMMAGTSLSQVKSAKFLISLISHELVVIPSEASTHKNLLSFISL